MQYCNKCNKHKFLFDFLTSNPIIMCNNDKYYNKFQLPPIGNRPGDVEKWIKKSLENLQLDYIDLYLVHVPFTLEDIGEDMHPKNEKGEVRFDTRTDHAKVWKEMEEQVKLGRTKAIGLSNFNETQISKVLSIASLPISNLQIELHVYFQQFELVSMII